MTDNHMVFFAEIAFIYGGNDSLEKDVFGSEKIIKSSERSSETTAISSGTGSGTHPHKILDTSGKDEHGDITAIFTTIICCIAWGYTVGETYLVSRHINIGAIETVSQYKLNYDFTFKVFDHENTVLTLKKCQYWQKFNVGVILLVNTSNISNMSNKHKKLLKTQIKK